VRHIFLPSRCVDTATSHAKIDAIKLSDEGHRSKTQAFADDKHFAKRTTTATDLESIHPTAKLADAVSLGNPYRDLPMQPTGGDMK
jgi:hypothetical protein